MNAVVRFWRGDRRTIRSKRQRSRRRTTGIASKGNPDGQAEGTTRHYSRVDGTCTRETTVRPAGTGFCKRRDPTAQPPAQSPNAARREHAFGCCWRKAELREAGRYLLRNG